MPGKVAIIGAGTAGLIAAKNIAAEGIETDVYDQNERPGFPPKASGIVSIAGLESLGISYKKAITNTLFGANIHAGNEILRVRAKGAQAHVVDRVLLSELCMDEAAASGARLRKPVRVAAAELDALHKSSLIIGADGPISTVARHFSMGGIREYALTYKAEYGIEPQDAKVVDMFFDSRISPGFFAWLCPKSKGVLEVGIGIAQGWGDSKSAFDRFVTQKGISDLLGKGRMLSGYASIIPLSGARRIVDAKNGVLLVGDAAGQTKKATGGGIVFGGNAAILAARAVVRNIKEGASLANYEREYHKKFGADLLLHNAVNGLYSSLDASGMEFAIKAMRMLGAEEFLSAYGDMDRPSSIIRRFFTRRGV